MIEKVQTIGIFRSSIHYRAFNYSVKIAVINLLVILFVLDSERSEDGRIYFTNHNNVCLFFSFIFFFLCTIRGIIELSLQK